MCEASALSPVVAKIRSGPSPADSASACPVARRSSQITPGRSGRSRPSTGTTPSTWEARPTCVTSDGATADRVSNCRTALVRPAREAAGSCSAQPFAGWALAQPCPADATVRPSGSSKTAFTLCEPMSAPIRKPMPSASRRSQSFVDEPPGGLVLRPVAVFEVEGRADADGHYQQVDRPQPLGVAVPAAQEVDVLEQQEHYEALGDERQRGRDDRLPPVHLVGVVAPEVEQDAERDQ